MLKKLTDLIREKKVGVDYINNFDNNWIMFEIVEDCILFIAKIIN